MSFVTFILIFSALLLLLGGYRVWRRMQYKLWLRQRSALFSSSYINIDDHQVHYWQTGSGSDLLLIHGIGASIYCWRLVVPLLSQSFRVTAVDLPGFGQSSKILGKNYDLDSQSQRIIEFCQHLDLKDVNVVGSSMGGAIGLWLAKLQPERFHRVAALAPATSPALVPFRWRRWVWITPVVHVMLGEWVMGRILRRIWHSRHLITLDTVLEYLEPYRKKEAFFTFAAAIEVLSDRRLPGELVDVNVPVLLIWGEHDKLVPHHFMDELKSILPNVIYIEHSEAGHHLMEDAPEWLYKRLVEFFK